MKEKQVKESSKLFFYTVTLYIKKMYFLEFFHLYFKHFICMKKIATELPGYTHSMTLIFKIELIQKYQKFLDKLPFSDVTNTSANSGHPEITGSEIRSTPFRRIFLFLVGSTA